MNSALVALTSKMSNFYVGLILDIQLVIIQLGVLRIEHMIKFSYDKIMKFIIEFCSITKYNKNGK